MAEPESTTSRPVQSSQGTFNRTQFRDLLNHRDVTAYYAVSICKEAVAYLNMGETERATRALLSALDLFQRADNDVNNFQKEVSRGNAAA